MSSSIKISLGDIGAELVLALAKSLYAKPQYAYDLAILVAAVEHLCERDSDGFEIEDEDLRRRVCGRFNAAALRVKFPAHLSTLLPGSTKIFLCRTTERSRALRDVSPERPSRAARTPRSAKKLAELLGHTDD